MLEKVWKEVLRVLGLDSAVEPKQPSPDSVPNTSRFHPLLHPLCELVERLRSQKEVQRREDLKIPHRRVCHPVAFGLPLSEYCTVVVSHCL